MFRMTQPQASLPPRLLVALLDLCSGPKGIPGKSIPNRLKQKKADMYDIIYV